ncbi:hypothetical protein K2173_027613 [Erythroxylum novogranatense]|uniref:SAM domain-containing protein n=1 Tax=Erythroxylum novogranatense TaxID=1862640 RepID=A0AAV8TZJ5_9ROSI|nr:hypothetical protein K2173_027613 [Erythroxylum novogranatense]
MAEIQPPEGHLNGIGGSGSGGASNAVTSSEAVGSKRQRRPSVRLGEIGGDHLYDAVQARRTSSNRQWRHNNSLSLDHSRKDSGKGSKTRALTNLTTSGDFAETLGDDKDANLDSVAIASWRVKDLKKRASNATTRRVRSNWVSKIGDGGGAAAGDNVDGDEKHSGAEVMENSFREFDMENSESPLKENSHIHSLENSGDGNEREIYYNRRGIRARDNTNDNHNRHFDGIELSGPLDNDARDYRNDGGGCVGGEDGVRIWLNSIGLGRYAPVFEIHEVDDEILPMLTLEDLKDMGINAVGSRRKMFCAIQKLSKGFS